MRTFPAIAGTFACAAVFGCLSSAAESAGKPPPSPHVLVIFTHPEKFTDIRTGILPSDERRDRLLESLRQFITERAALYLPSGDALYINFVDIRLAGIMVPVGVMGLDGVRVASHGTPPRFVFGWAITDRSGAVVRKGSGRLMNSDFMGLWSPTDSGDPYHYEKAVLEDWMRQNIQT